MSASKFHIERLQISRMPGFADGLRVADTLSPNLNLIVGPNASGKSSIARAILKTLWQEKPKNYSVQLDAQNGADNWNLVIGPGFSETTRNGSKSEEMLTSIDRSRYLLGLHELIQAEESDIAAEIHRQINGGFDLEQAARSAGFSDQISTRAISEYKALDKAEREVVEKKRVQQDFQKDQHQLADLHGQLEEIKKQLRKENLYKLSLDLREVNRKTETMTDRLAAFPEAMELLRQQDFDEVQTCGKEVDELLKKIDFDKSQLAEFENKLQQLGLPETGMPEETLLLLTALVDDLHSLKADKSKRESDLIRAQQELSNAAANLDLTDSNWSGLTVADVRILEQAWVKAFGQYEAVNGLQKEVEAIEKRLSQISADIPARDHLVQGVRTLTRWLQEQQNQTVNSETPQWPIYVLAVLAVLATLVTTFVSSLIVLLVLMPVIALIGLMVYLTQKKSSVQEESGSAAVYQKDFENLGITMPPSWQIDEVANHIATLTNLLPLNAEKQHLKVRLDQVKGDWQTAEDALKQHFENFESVCFKLGFAAENRGKNHPGSLYWLLVNTGKWLDARNECDAASAEMALIDAKTKETLDQFNAQLASLKVSLAANYAEAKTKSEYLRKSESERRSLVSQISTTKRLLTDRQENCDKLNGQIDEIYRRLKIESHDLHQLQSLHQQFENYTETVRQMKELNWSIEKINRELQAHAMYEVDREKLDMLSDDELFARLSESEQLRKKRDDLQSRIGGIEAFEKNYREGNDLQYALKIREDALVELETAFERNLLNHSGTMVTQVFQKANQQHNESTLFKRANALFQTITRNRFSIQILPGNHKSFSAFDEVKRLNLPLNQLSTGTRIQLLLAVRLAYIETQEKNYRLPLFADELLANSDDVRAQAIIEALIEISKIGRQVFYFTAQEDEVNKWQERLQLHRDIQYKVIDLEGAEGKAIDWDQVPTRSDRTENVPAPESDNHWQYGRRVGVPQFNLMMHPVSQLHLWYLTDDVQLLYEFLRHQIRFWGQVESMANKPPLFAPSNWDRIYHEMHRRVDLIQIYQKLYQTGRSKPIDREVLLDSGAVSSTFIDDTDELLNTLHGVPEELLDALRNKTIAGFRTGKIEELESFLFERRFITNDEPLPEGELMNHLYSEAAKLHLEPNSVSLLLQRIHQGQNG